ncbi:MAG TPA: hypothetical protein DD405_00815 [Desulfobacteraceae bacterium]|nr:hypothetical protein [Desulfobacteraceae bacterium]
MAIKNSLTEQSLFIVIGRSIAYLISILLPIILVRIFTQEEYGLYKQIFLIFSTLLPFGQMGVAQSLYYFLPRHPEKKNILMTQTFIFILFTGAFILCTLLIFQSSIAAIFHNKEMLQYIPLLAMYSFFMISSSFLEISMIAEGEAKIAALTFALSQIANSGILIVSAVFTESIFFLMCGAVLFSISRFIVQCIYLKKKYRISFNKIDFKFWKKQLSYSLPIGLGNISWLLQTQIHQYFVSYFFNPIMFAVYSIGCFNLPILNIITSSAGNVMIPALSRHQKEENKNQILNIWYNTIRKMNLLLLPAFAFFFIMAEEFIVVLFTANYTESVPIFRINILAILISGINSGAILQAYAETKFLMKIAFIRLPVIVIILYFFITTWGVLGAVAANVVSLYFFRFILLCKVKKVLDLPFVKLINWKINITILLTAFLSGLPLVLIKIFLNLPPLFLLIVSSLLYTASYLILSVRMDIITKHEIEKLKNYFFAKFSILKKITILYK